MLHFYMKNTLHVYCAYHICSGYVLCLCIFLLQVAYKGDVLFILGMVQHIAGLVAGSPVSQAEQIVAHASYTLYILEYSANTAIQ